MVIARGAGDVTGASGHVAGNVLFAELAAAAGQNRIVRITGTGLSGGMNQTLPAWDRQIDCEGLLCPLPVLRARKTLLAMQPGQVLCVRATDAMAAVDLPHFCASAAHSYLGSRLDGGVTLHLVRVGGPT